MTIHLIFALVVSLFLVTLLADSYRKDGGNKEIYFPFLLIFFMTWAASLWLAPIGPPASGVSWIPLLVLGLVFALLMAANGHPRHFRNTRSRVGHHTATLPESNSADTETVIFAGVLFFLILFSVLVQYVL